MGMRPPVDPANRASVALRLAELHTGMAAPPPDIIDAAHAGLADVARDGAPRPGIDPVTAQIRKALEYMRRQSRRTLIAEAEPTSRKTIIVTEMRLGGSPTVADLVQYGGLADELVIEHLASLWRTDVDFLPVIPRQSGPES